VTSFAYLAPLRKAHLYERKSVLVVTPNTFLSKYFVVNRVPMSLIPLKPTIAVFVIATPTSFSTPPLLWRKVRLLQRIQIGTLLESVWIQHKLGFVGIYGWDPQLLGSNWLISRRGLRAFRTAKQSLELENLKDSGNDKEKLMKAL
jgi:hypothetical protein